MGVAAVWNFGGARRCRAWSGR